MQTFVLRLTPGQDLKKELTEWVRTQNISAGIILSCVGSLQSASLRLAGAQKPSPRQGPFEIVSLVGTLSTQGLHLHIALADKEGLTWGGHLLEDCFIHTTAEIAIADLNQYNFEREMDPATGYKELKILKMNTSPEK